jgi:hypothetical protein
MRTAKSCGPDASVVGVKSAEATSPMTVSNKPDHRLSNAHIFLVAELGRD